MLSHQPIGDDVSPYTTSGHTRLSATLIMANITVTVTWYIGILYNHFLPVFALVRHHTLSVVFLKPTATRRPSVAPSDLHKVPQIRQPADIAALIGTKRFFFTYSTYVLISIDILSLFVWLMC